MPASFSRIRPFAALYASSASFDLRRSYIAVMRSSFSTSLRGSSATLSINAKTVEGLSDGGAGDRHSTGRSLCSVSSVGLACFFIRIPFPVPHHSVFSVLRLCHPGTSNIGSDLIAMTPLQQEKRVHRSAKKAVPYQGKNDLARGPSVTHLSRVWNHASFSEEMGPVVCPSRGSPDGSLLASASSRRPIASLPNEGVWKRNYSQNARLRQ